MKFRKKPVVIEAVRVEQRMDILSPDWFYQAVASNKVTLHNMGKWTDQSEPRCLIRTLEGTMRAEIGDWIVQGVAGELYPCKPDIFAATYEAADAAPAPVPPAAKAVEMDATRAAMALALEAMQDALEDVQLAQSEYDGRTYSFCTSCGADDLQTPTVGKHTPHCAWGKVLAAISELELQIAALSKQGGNHG